MIHLKLGKIFSSSKEIFQRYKWRNTEQIGWIYTQVEYIKSYLNQLKVY